MNSNKMALIVLLVSLPGVALAERADNIRYSGDNLAKQVCKAVVDDDVPRLRLALRTYKQSLAHSYNFDLAGRELARDFTCNGMDVQAFSRHVGAAKVAGFFTDAGKPSGAQVAISGS